MSEPLTRATDSNPVFPACPLFILVVEDHAEAAQNLALLLRFHGHEVLIAHDEAEALATLEIAQPDVILMDIGLPDSSGYEVARRLCVRLGRKPLLVAVTGYTHLREKSWLSGFDHHIEKPVDPNELAELLRRHAERVAATAQPAR